MSDETTDEPDREGQEGNGAERDEDSAERIRYTLEPRQRLIFLGVGLLLFVVQLFNGNLGYAIAFLAAFVALYFAWGQWGVELRSDGLFLSGFQTQEVPWERIREIKSTRFLATDRVIVELTDDSLVRPRAPISNPIQRDQGFEGKVETIREYCEARQAELEAEAEAEEKAKAEQEEKEKAEKEEKEKAEKEEAEGAEEEEAEAGEQEKGSPTG